MLNGIFASVYGSSLTFGAFCITTLVSLGLGALLAFVYSRDEHSSGSMTTSLLVLPFLVHVVILLVNGNLGAGVAVAGTFSLVRFRSAPGSARDIAVIFLAMTVGLACGDRLRRADAPRQGDGPDGGPDSAGYGAGKSGLYGSVCGPV